MLIQSFQQTYKKHETWPGVPVYTEPTTSASKGKGRGTVEQVYTQINDDLTAALTRFEECGIAQEHISNLDYYATSLLKARVALVQNDWPGGCRSGCRGDEETGPFAAQQDRRHGREGHVRRRDEELDHGKTPFNSVASSSVLWGAEMLSEQSTVYASFFSNMGCLHRCLLGGRDAQVHQQLALCPDSRHRRAQRVVERQYRHSGRGLELRGQHQLQPA